MAAQNGNLRFSVPPGVPFNVSMYLNDTAANFATFSRSGKAGATDTNFLQFNRAVALEDMVIAAATGQTTSVLYLDDVPAEPYLNSQYLASVTTRPPINRLIPGGTKIQVLQVP